MKQLLTSLAGCLVFASICMGQSKVENQEKYWDFRNALIQDYMIVGDGAGKSIPATGKDDEAKYIFWGDATIRLGWYMSVLATEYHLSLKNGHTRTEAENTIAKEQTVQELYYALRAIQRLDSLAEPFFNPEMKPQVNGFFMRDDVTKKFIDKLNNKEYMVSDYTSVKKSDNEESQDQVHHMLMGLMSIYQFVPEAVEYKGMRIADEAKTIAVRIIDWNRSNGWKVVNPAELDKKGKPTHVARGAEAYIFSAGTIKTLSQFKGGNLDEKKRLNPLNRLFWSSLRLGINPTYIKDDNSHMAMTVNATGNGFQRGTYRKLAKKSFRHDWYVYPLLNLAMYPENRRWRKDEKLIAASRTMLDSAPAEGIESGIKGIASSTGWTVHNRFMRKKSQLYKVPSRTKSEEYAGLDYMLLHNLYLIHQQNLLLERNANRN